MTRNQYDAIGLQGSWLNGWMAALGTTCVLPGTTLSWTDAASPHAVFEYEGDDFFSDLLIRLSASQTVHVPITGIVEGLADIGQKISLDSYVERTRIERHLKGWTLASAVSDLALQGPNSKEFYKSRFNVALPGSNHLQKRVATSHDYLKTPAQIQESFGGLGERRVYSGLGFDSRQLTSRAEGFKRTDSAPPVHADPVVEALAFEAFRFFPARAQGNVDSLVGTTRGWEGRTFTWPTWTNASLDMWAIDAFLGSYYAETTHGLSIPAEYEVVEYRKPPTSKEVKVGFASRKIS